MEPVVIIRAWIWLTAFRVLHFWRRTRVGNHGRFAFAQRSINVVNRRRTISLICDTECDNTDSGEDLRYFAKDILIFVFAFSL